MHELLHQIRLGLRQIRKAPAFSAAVILILALATGANSAIFSLLDGLWLRPLAVPSPSQIVRVFAVTDQGGNFGFSYPEYREFAKQSKDVVQLIAIDRRGAFVPRPDGSLELTSVNGVSSNFFSALGIRAALGSLPNPSDDDSSGPLVAVLGNNYWHRAYGADPDIIGKQVRVMRNGPHLVTIIGVLPETFRELDAASEDRELWFPERTWKEMSNIDERGYRGFQIEGRLMPGVSRVQAQTKLQSIAAALAQQWPEFNRGRTIRVVSDLKQRWEDAGVHGEMLVAIVVLLMLLCAVNVANLFLARGAQREHELSIRLSLGANRLQLFQYMFVESLVLGVFGIAVGLLVGRALIQVLPSLFVPPPNIHALFTFQLNRSVLLLSTIVGLLTTVAFGCFSAIRAAASSESRITPVSSSAGRSTHTIRLHRWLVVAQVSISLVLLVGTGLVIRSFTNTRTADLGISRHSLLNVWITAPFVQQPALLQEIDETLASIPGVRRVANAVRAPLSLSSGGMSRIVDIPDAPQPPGTAPREILYNSVSANYLHVIGTPVLLGRGFEPSDERVPKVVIINETMAKTFWPNASPIDRIVKIGKSAEPFRIVGIAKDAPIQTLADRAVPYMYIPFGADPQEEQTFVLEYSGDPDLIAPIVRSRLAGLNSNIILFGITTEHDLIRYAAGEYALTAVLVSALGLLAMLLTACGLFGTMSYAVNRRTREIGIRMALGSSRRDTLLLVMHEIARIAAIGLLIGIPLTLISTRLSAAAFFGISPWHLPTMFSMTALVTIVLFAAGYGPAYRASRIDPMRAIREE
ncbi:MAG: ABC transporter permease [Acidobacteriaceae bacterium]